MNNLNIPKTLQDAIENERLVLFIGAGLSIGSGLPSWGKIVEEILGENEQYIDNSHAYITALNAKIMSPLEVLDKLSEHKKIIYKSFEKILNRPTSSSEIHASLGRLTKRFVTTNFDTLIESNTDLTNVITHESNYNLSKIDDDDEYVVKIHGDISRVDKCIIFSEQYDSLYQHEQLATFQLKKLLSKYNFLFVGFSFNDPYVKELFDYVSSMLEGYGPKHYFVSDNDVNIEHLESININDYAKLNSFVDNLLSFKPSAESVIAADSETPKDKFIKDIDGSDRAPTVKGWVGRGKELSILHSDTFKVIFITGIGGEGKSALASHYIAEEEQYSLTDWRDFKEEDHKFQHKIASMIQRVDPTINAKELMGLSDEELVDLFFLKLGQKKALFVLDNVDSYIDLENFEPVNGVGYLFYKAIELDHNSKFMFTCRPFIRFASVEFYQLSLSGLTEKNTIDFFLNSATNISKDKLEIYAKRAFELTNGHALWLSLIIAQSHRGEKSLIAFLDKIESGISIDENDSTILSKNVLSNIWTSLHERDRLLLRTLAESVVAESTEDYAEILRSELNYNQYQKALKALRNFNLVVEKRGSNYIELHPLVKEFIRKNYQTSERNKYISLIATYYDKFIYVLREKLSYKLSFDEFVNFTNKAELSINAGDYQNAINSLWEVHDSMVAAGYNEEFLRVGKLLLSSITWSKKRIDQFENFYLLMAYIIRCLVEYGDDEYALKFIEKYESLINNKEEAYIRLCDIKSYRYWFKCEYPRAINVCEEAIYLLEKGNQEDKFSIAHTLALAQRDSGESEEIHKALEYFRGTTSLEELLSTEKITRSGNGPMLGNIGKCMYLMGDLEKALICYTKSYYCLFESDSHNRLINLGYASFWLAELLLELGKNEVAYYFYRFAFESWSNSSPVLSNRHRSKIEPNSTYRSIYSQELWRVEKYCNDWVKKTLDIK
ncbi:NB-ARC domain-containing protein [Microbulbifer donghaiensis]|uniref:NB-ARC domain-containing protein n=1 Tax=Microbulbifer donghaiensis TaxID=494016 RepID=A0A1M4W4P0_9GAMM|nr:SIR2 family protein [Microbulbifer donghaiensis]SHE76115.1 NB-ARC domain-containing protein [Microbulbifer donghaiensis]